MSNRRNSKTGSSQPPTYQIRVEGHLDQQWIDWFEGLAITSEEDGKTLLTGWVADQAALHGLLKKIRDLGIVLVSVNRVQPNETNRSFKKAGRTTWATRMRSDFRIKTGEKMDTGVISTKKIDPKVLLSTLWIVVMINMLKADILALYIPGTAEELMETSASVGTAIPQLMLGGAIMMEISIAMIILARVLKPNINRWVNIVVSMMTIAFVVGGGSSYPHYLFVASVEVICLLLIIRIAWQWRSPESQPVNQHARSN